MPILQIANVTRSIARLSWFLFSSYHCQKFYHLFSLKRVFGLVRNSIASKLPASVDFPSLPKILPFIFTIEVFRTCLKFQLIWKIASVPENSTLSYFLPLKYSYRIFLLRPILELVWDFVDLKSPSVKWRLDCRILVHRNPSIVHFCYEVLEIMKLHILVNWALSYFRPSKTVYHQLLGLVYNFIYLNNCYLVPVMFLLKTFLGFVWNFISWINACSWKRPSTSGFST